MVLKNQGLGSKTAPISVCSRMDGGEPQRRVCISGRAWIAGRLQVGRIMTRIQHGEKVRYGHLTGPNALSHQNDFSRPALRHVGLNSHFFSGSRVPTFLVTARTPDQPRVLCAFAAGGGRAQQGL